MGEVARPGLKLSSVIFSIFILYFGGMGEVARPGLKRWIIIEEEDVPLNGGMGEVARPGLKQAEKGRKGRRVSRWNGRGGPSGFETRAFPLTPVMVA